MEKFKEWTVKGQEVVTVHALRWVQENFSLGNLLHVHLDQDYFAFFMNRAWPIQCLCFLVHFSYVIICKSLGAFLSKLVKL